MPRNRYTLTPIVHERIVSSIRGGGYPHVAAEAWGPPQQVFDRWLALGSRNGAREPYRSFASDVRAACAQARLRAEIEAYEGDPKSWLLHGPGREGDDRAGWSLSVKPARRRAEAEDVLSSPSWTRNFTRVVDGLVPLPEARRHVAEVLEDIESNKSGEDENGETSVPDDPRGETR